ncbi:MAG: glutamate--tRNA ligase [Alphaproteobacteria bacterium]|nr:glutamate--tRNA ligase [Alphaproteobacteria bacterium]
MTPEILDLLFPNELPTVAEIETKYPSRELPEGAVVSRLAPSPTGYLHIGNFYQGFMAERLAHQHNGVFFLRVEDTDQARKVEGAVEVVLNALAHYGIRPDEGRTLDGEIGDYAPYTQSERKEIYQAYAKELVAKGAAYPCFCTTEEIDLVRKIQSKQGLRTGYYGHYAKCRNLTDDEVLANLKAGKPFCIRLKSTGDYSKRIVVDDLLKGKVSLPEYDVDVPIIKGADGLPTYHFAHLIDDHLMQTTHVVRGEEWLSSLPLHIQLFNLMGWQPPQYAHHALLQKLGEDGKRRKISKRLDPEANIEYFAEHGYPQDAVLEYLLNLMNASFEDWRKENPTVSVFDFPMDIHKISNTAGALFDMVKLNSIAREVVARMTAEEVYDKVLTWAKEYKPDFANVLENNREKCISIFNIERGIGTKSRKDLFKWEDAEKETEFFFQTPAFDEKLLDPIAKDDVVKVALEYAAIYNPSDSKEEWFAKIKEIAGANGFATDMKAYKADPKSFKGSVSDVAKILRVAITGRTQSPDLYAIMQILGKDEVLTRLNLNDRC